MGEYIIRPAVEGDQAAIKAIIRAAGINPMALDWPRFLVADDGGKIIGTGQIKPHGDGSRELASIAVIPERQRQGVAAAIIRALLAKESGTLYLTCQKRMAGYYARFGFRRVQADEMTPYFRRIMRITTIPGAIGARILRREIQLVVMRRDGPTAGS